MTTLINKSLEGKFISVDKEEKIAYGWAVICKRNGEDYYDLQNHHISEEEMTKAAIRFAKSAKRTGLEDHRGEVKGHVVFMMPMSMVIAKSMGIKTDKSGLMIGWLVEDPKVLAKIEAGEHAGFSIGGGAFPEEVDS